MEERVEKAKEHQQQKIEEAKNKKIKLNTSQEKNTRLKASKRIKMRKYLIELGGMVCSICSKTFEENSRFIHLDHCHETGDIRGLLCHNCNIGLGCFKDDISLLEKAINYLESVDRKTKDKMKAAMKKRVHPSWEIPVIPLPIPPQNIPWWLELKDFTVVKLTDRDATDRC